MGAGVLAAMLLLTLLGGFSPTGASTNGGWFALIVALMCLPFGGLLLTLGVANGSATALSPVSSGEIRYSHAPAQDGLGVLSRVWTCDINSAVVGTSAILSPYWSLRKWPKALTKSSCSAM